MKRLESLTLEQEAGLKGYAQSWIDRLDKGAPLDKEAASRGVDSLYALINKPAPLKVFVSSPLGCQFAIAILKELTEESVFESVRQSVRQSVGVSVGQSVEESVGQSVFESVWQSVRQSVEESVWQSVRQSVEESVRQSVGRVYESFCWYGSFCTDSYWIAFYRWFEKEGICDYNNPKWDAFAELIEANMYDSIQFEGVHIGCDMPIELHRDESGRLHSTSGMAIKWSDGYGVYSLWGVRFDWKLFEDLTQGKLSAKEVLAITNTEQRMAALKYLGADKILGELDTKLIDSQQGYALLSIHGMTNQTEYALRYSCPSTGREYISFVDPEIGKKKDAIEAIASKWNMTKQEWGQIACHS